MIICEFTPTGGELIRCAMQDFTNVHLWKSFLISVSSLKISMPQRWGGLAEPTFSDVSFSPDMFAGNWPPPDTATVKMRWVEDGDETAGVVVFDGSARLSGLEYGAVKYTLKRPENNTKVPTATVFSGTLATVMATLCGPTYLNKTLNTDRAMIPSPAVSYTTTTETLTKDFASSLCESFCHGLVEEGNALYLIDMYDITNNQETIDSYGVVQTTSAKTDTAYSTAKSGETTVTSATVKNCDELSVPTIYHGTPANITAALTTMLEIANRPVIQLDAWVTARVQKIGGVYVYPDAAHYLPLQTVVAVSDIVYNFDTEILQATGAGLIA